MRRATIPETSSFAPWNPDSRAQKSSGLRSSLTPLVKATCCIAAAWEKARASNPPTKHWLRLLKPAQAPSKSAALELVPLTTVWRSPFHIRHVKYIFLFFYFCAASEWPVAFRAGAWPRHFCDGNNVPGRVQPERNPHPSFAFHTLIFILIPPLICF
jgi:hypothetical protein